MKKVQDFEYKERHGWEMKIGVRNRYDEIAFPDDIKYEEVFKDLTLHGAKGKSTKFALEDPKLKEALEFNYGIQWKWLLRETLCVPFDPKPKVENLQWVKYFPCIRYNMAGKRISDHEDFDWYFIQLSMN